MPIFVFWNLSSPLFSSITVHFCRDLFLLEYFRIFHSVFVVFNDKHEFIDIKPNIFQRQKLHFFIFAVTLAIFVTFNIS